MSEILSAIKDIRSWPSNFIHNTQSLVNTTDAKTIIRVIVIIGGYCLLRPFILKAFAKTSMKNHESLDVMDSVMKGESVDIKKVKGKMGARAGANAFRDGGAAKKEEDEGKGGSEDEEGGDATGADWGVKARRRQRIVESRREREREIRRKVEDGEADDKDILDLLVDYEEGEDGW